MNRSELNSIATAQAITDSFFKSFIQNGFDDINIGNICADSHISRTTFYRYFNDKYDVLEKTEEYLLKGTDAFTEKLLGDEEILSVLQFIKSNMFYYRVILGSDFSRRFMVKWSRQINEGFGKRFEEKGEDPNGLKLRVVSGGFLAGVSYWIEKDPEMELREIVNLYKNAC